MEHASLPLSRYGGGDTSPRSNGVRTEMVEEKCQGLQSAGKSEGRDEWGRRAGLCTLVPTLRSTECAMAGQEANSRPVPGFLMPVGGSRSVLSSQALTLVVGNSGVPQGMPRRGQGWLGGGLVGR